MRLTKEKYLASASLYASLFLWLGGACWRLDSRVERDSHRTAGDRRLSSEMSRRWDALIIALGEKLHISSP
jgi:hypothetical protein